MSLYDGLDFDNKESSGGTKAVPGWSPGYKLLQSQLQAKKAALLQSKKQRSSVLAPVVDLKRHSDDGPISFNLHTGRIERHPTSSAPAANVAVGATAAPFIASDAIPSFTGVTDEYNPLAPNEYDDLVKKKKEEKEKDRKRDQEERSERRRSRGDNEREMDKMRRKKEEEEEEEIDRGSVRGGGAAIAPPPSLMEDTEIRTVEKPEGMNMLNSVATKIMAKYGYREGQGLGKSEQGMSTALYVEKTSKRGGKIIHEKDIPKGATVPFVLPEEMLKEPISNTNLMKNPSKVVLLTNMVGPGEVDEELEPETAEECSKYGKVTKVIIFEMPEADDDEAVRIFVEFERMESAIKAIVDLNGRYFGGRVVRGSFYNLDKFRRLDLAGPAE
ncbi:splicing factor 45-like isoform X2 [Pomacea canaliculata]|uniref:splicing factor 45-like isoform X2 n=1 Tax=Pomacea canaliculata TaxID=400727 RepID=UPI000D7360FC|nr:splicing factor 45-like isoform X2 [Pomacea canaliculata]